MVIAEGNKASMSVAVVPWGNWAAMQSSRMLFICNIAGFYEWQHFEGHKQPYFIRMANSGLMAFAGLWEKWKSAEDEDFLETFTILTTSANELITPIHTRMPVLLHPEDYNLWLDQNMHDPEQMQRLYQPFPTDLLTAYKVPDLVNNPRFDSPACIAKV